MGDTFKGSVMDTRPSAAEVAAQAWHDDRHDGMAQKCWCCCTLCREANPHHRAARRAALDDIAKRIRDSVASNPQRYPARQAAYQMRRARLRQEQQG